MTQLAGVEAQVGGPMTITDRAVLVTGANRGLGQALVEEALRRGATRVYAGTRQPLTHPDERVMALSLDVTDAAQIRAAVERVESLDVLINNAGVDLHGDLSDRVLLERATLSIIANLYTERGERARAIGLWGAMTGPGSPWGRSPRGATPVR
jgi:NAD(P)-dependent dehydrogenase (short-subunit alcohol dehydrogenase family)